MGFSGKLESSNVSRDNVSREIGRNCMLMLLFSWLVVFVQLPAQGP